MGQVLHIAYDFTKRLQTLKGPTSCEFICKTWTNKLQQFTMNPIHQRPD